MNYLISLIIGYLFGSFPSAYLLLKKIKNIDITKAGSGNVGAMNSFDVTKSKTIGILVFIVDLLKGIVPIIILSAISFNSFEARAVALIGCVFSHCYNPWLEFKGGRGLASAAGGTAVIFPFALVAWAVLWSIFYLMKKNIIIANVTASVMTLLIIFTSNYTATKYAYPKPDSDATLILFSMALILIIISKHIEPIQEILRNLKASKRR